MREDDIDKIVDYFINSDAEYLKGMGADKNKMPEREGWIMKLISSLEKPYHEKEFYYIIWLIDNEPIGHSNINHIEFGKSAKMHLHLWNQQSRKKGIGQLFLKQTVPYYFNNFKLDELICEPYSKNIGPNKVLKKVGFEFVKSYKTTPEWINFHQTVNHYILKKDNWTK